jgi:hypothetical protein
MILLGLKNTTTQTIPAEGLIDFGTVYRKYIARGYSNNCLCTASTTAPTISQKGMYHVIVTVTFTADAAGDVTLQLLENSVPVPGAVSVETVTTADTQVITTTFDYIVLVSCANVLGTFSTQAKSISVQSDSAIEVTNAVINIIKEV